MNAQLLTTTLLKQAKWVQTVHTAVQLTRNNFNHLSGCKTQLQFCVKNSHSLVSSPSQQTYWCVGFWPFTTAQFNTAPWIFVTGSKRLGWDQVAGESVSHSPTNEQITLSSASSACTLYGTKLSFSHLPYCVPPKCVCLLLKITLILLMPSEVLLFFMTDVV